jgi:ATP-dependent metalloprotease
VSSVQCPSNRPALPLPFCLVDVDLGLVARATPGFSGADLHKLINQAKIMASVENSSMLTMRHLEGSRDEMLMGAERKSFIISEEERRLTAFHEGGHALVALYTLQATPLHKATIIPRGAALGLVSQVPEKDEHSLTKQALLARMDVAMGGRVAEELLYGLDAVTTGASSDFSQATRIARAMVMQYGMSERLGPMVVDAEEMETLGPELRSAIDSEIQRILEESKNRALGILQGHREELEWLAAALLEHETLTKDEIVAVVRGEQIRRAMSVNGGESNGLLPKPPLGMRRFSLFL